jgi:hypothetical protein
MIKNPGYWFDKEAELSMRISELNVPYYVCSFRKEAELSMRISKLSVPYYVSAFWKEAAAIRREQAAHARKVNAYWAETYELFNVDFWNKDGQYIEIAYSQKGKDLFDPFIKDGTIVEIINSVRLIVRDTLARLSDNDAPYSVWLKNQLKDHDDVLPIDFRISYALSNAEFHSWKWDDLFYGILHRMAFILENPDKAKDLLQDYMTLLKPREIMVEYACK